MSRIAFDFLERSPLWRTSHHADAFGSLSDGDLLGELSNYRKHVLGGRVPVAKGLSVAFTAQHGAAPDANGIKPSVLYFDEVLLPDPVFDLSGWTRNRDRMPAESRTVDREEIIQAVLAMRRLAPLVRIGRVRFVPTTVVLEPPERLPLLRPGDSFESRVPDFLRDWFQKRARIRKVVLDAAQSRRLVLASAPDANTSSIQVGFGQKGPESTYDHLRPISIDETTRTVVNELSPPGDDEAMQAWLRQSTNASAGAFLRAVIADVGLASKLNCSFVTSCAVTADLLDRIALPRASDSNTIGPALSLDLPIIANASIEQIAALIQAETAAFEAFRAELRATSEALATIEDADNRAAESRQASKRLAHEQVHEVDQRIREAQRGLKYSLPVTAAVLAAGAFTSIATGGIAAALAAVFAGAAAVGSTAEKYHSHRLLPGYFLWKLKKTRRSGADI